MRIPEGKETRDKTLVGERAYLKNEWPKNSLNLRQEMNIQIQEV